MVILVMGVSGAGKTVVGRRLAETLGWPFIDGDDYHPAENVDKMRRGIPLDDADRAPWLATVHRAIEPLRNTAGDLVVACSALKASYRAVLLAGVGPSLVVHLTAPADVLAERLGRRAGHFMPPTLLASQLETLEPPEDALVLDATHSVDELVEAIRAAMGRDRM